jgi:hypothetical protein
MTTAFTLENCQDISDKISIDELYDRKKQTDLNNLEFYRKMLHRIHVRIKSISKTSKDRCCWYTMPEMILGARKYDQAGCIAYVMDSLIDNGFKVKYFHPNIILIAWEHWIPEYVRDQIRKKTGIRVNEFGEQIADNDGDRQDARNMDEYDPTDIMLSNQRNGVANAKPDKKYTPVDTYKPTGTMVYDTNLFKNDF